MLSCTYYSFSLFCPIGVGDWHAQPPLRSNNFGRGTALATMYRFGLFDWLVVDNYDFPLSHDSSAAPMAEAIFYIF
jgi:hypothetical protein